jgi:hypothetical protein
MIGDALFAVHLPKRGRLAFCCRERHPRDGVSVSIWADNPAGRQTPMSQTGVHAKSDLVAARSLNADVCHPWFVIPDRSLDASMRLTASHCGRTVAATLDNMDCLKF